MKGYLFIVGTLIVVISGLITLNIFFQQSLQMEIAEQFNKQQLLLSKSIADNIGSYLYFLRQDALHMSEILSEDNLDWTRDFEWLKKDVLLKKRKIKTTVAVLDSRGGVLFSEEDAGLLKPAIPVIRELSGKLDSGSPMTIELPPFVYTISPIHRRGRTTGVLLLAFRIDDIAQTFVSSIKSGSRGYAWMMDKGGTLLYHPKQPGMVGGNIYRTDTACFKCHLSFDLEKRITEGRADNFGRYIAPSGEDKIIAFSTVNIDNLSWIIAVSSPYSEVTRTTKHSMELYSYLIVSIFITTSIVSAILIVFNKKRIKAEEVARRKEELEKYAVELENKVSERTLELRGEKEKMDTVVSAIGGGIVLIDTKGKIQWANQMMREMAGMDVIGMYCENLCPDCPVAETYTKGDIETAILTNLFGHKDKYYQVTTAPVKGADGELHGYIKLIQDVTEIKKMEGQMIHSEKLASIGRLAAGIAHEIGNPLTSIFSFVQILREMEQEEFKKESLETIYFHVNRISEILKQLSGFSKMPAAAAEPKKCQINEIIETSINLIQYDKKAKNTSIVRELSTSLPEAAVDGNQLSQVFVNLILNAMDAMQDGGTLTVRSEARESDLIVRFEDTGIGIPEEDMPKIFDPFYTTKEKGTGLGLAVSYNIIKKMGGRLDVQSEMGHGTTFTITIPFKT